MKHMKRRLMFSKKTKKRNEISKAEIMNFINQWILKNI